MENTQVEATQGMKVLKPATILDVMTSEYYNMKYVYYPLESGEVLILDSSNFYDGNDLINALDIGDEFTMLVAR